MLPAQLKPRTAFAQVTVLVLLLFSAVAPPALSAPVFGGGGERHGPADVAPSGLRIVGADGSEPPVVNESGKLRLVVLDAAFNEVAVRSWASDNAEVATVSASGKLRGRAFGVASVAATTESGARVETIVAVARVTPGGGRKARGDTTTDRAGAVYLSSPDESVIYRSSGLRDEVFAGKRGEASYADGERRRARFRVPTGLGVDNRSGGGLYVADTGNQVIRKVSFTGRAETVLGRAGEAGRVGADGAPFDEARVDGPRGVAALGDDLVVADTNNHALLYADLLTRRLAPLAGVPGEAGLADGPGAAARFRYPSSLARNSEGTLLAVADTGNDRVRLVRLARGEGGRLEGVVTTLGAVGAGARGTRAGEFVAPVSVAFDGLENLYVVDAMGPSVVLKAASAPERVGLAQAGTFEEAASLATEGTRVLVLDAGATKAKEAVRVVEIGPPSIEAVTPDRAGVTGGTAVVVRGANFGPETRVTLGDAEVEGVERVGTRELRFFVPEQRAHGARTLSVLTRGGVAQRKFSILPPRL